MQNPVRSLRNQESAAKGNLPTIAGSPSTHLLVDSASSQSIATLSSTDAHSKPNTPTKIPRLQYRATIAESSLPPRLSEPSSDLAVKPHRRASHFGTTSDATPRTPSYAPISSQLPSETELFSTVDFGTTREPGLALGERSLATRRRLGSDNSQIPRSRSTTTPSASIRLPKEESTSAVSSRAGTVLPRSFGMEEGASSTGTSRTGGTPRLPTAASESNFSLNVVRRASKVSEGPALPAVRRASALSTSATELPSARSSRTISNKMGPPARTARGMTTPAMSPAPSDSSRSVSSASQNGPVISEEELRADEEMSAYVRRQRTKKLATGISAETIQKMFEFPDPTAPIPPLSCRGESARNSSDDTILTRARQTLPLCTRDRSPSTRRSKLRVTPRSTTPARTSRNFPPVRKSASTTSVTTTSEETTCSFRTITFDIATKSSTCSGKDRSDRCCSVEIIVRERWSQSRSSGTRSDSIIKLWSKSKCSRISSNGCVPVVFSLLK